MSLKETIESCKELKRKKSAFHLRNNPARICTASAFIIPLILLALTSHSDSKANTDLSNSPYSLHAGIIFLVLLGLGIFLSRKADPHKISEAEEWTIKVYDTYQDVVEYNSNTSLLDVKHRACDRFTILIDEMNSSFNSLDAIMKCIPHTNQIQKLIDSIDQNVLPVLETEDENQLPELETYLIRFTEYLLEPNEHLLNELLQIKVPMVENLEEKTSKLNLLKNKPIKKIAIFLSILIGSSIVIYMIAVDIGVEKNYAFGGSIAVFAALGATFRHYLEK